MNDLFKAGHKCFKKFLQVSRKLMEILQCIANKNLNLYFSEKAGE